MGGKIEGFTPLLMIPGIMVEGRNYAVRSWMRDHSQRIYHAGGKRRTDNATRGQRRYHMGDGGEIMIS